MIDFQGYGPRLLDGALLTFELAVLSLILAVALGLLAASAKLSGSRLAHGVATFYTTVVRGVPDLVLMMLLFYGGQIGVNMLTDQLYYAFDIDIFININAFVAGVVTIGFIFGAYMSETFRGAFLAVEEGQMEAARAYGMSGWLAFRRIRFPLMMRHALPGLGNNWMVLLKTTALVSIIGLTDMVRVAAEATKATHEPFLFMIPVALGYLAITSVSELVMLWLRKRYDTGFEEQD
ncbi:amino acid ABC transporter membrane protein 1 (PAAT family) [Kushneria sinocarnis]|uniref:Amino acid ABC transporter membrane protein 1 (PAAT family) n=1 Tax=Kushneria sinocarnis TaxID=595502 RepID=A0A420WZS7_9GAMM|nr:ABC transporter permease [Kushneria sinocarnis]RKR06853.1 amino acid ABC transporter membrane protein 1 (PAAT family) [Kushneria sinocarnis]